MLVWLNQTSLWKHWCRSFLPPPLVSTVWLLQFWSTIMVRAKKKKKIGFLKNWIKMKTVKKYPYPLAAGFSDLAAGICCGLSGLAAGNKNFFFSHFYFFCFFVFWKFHFDLILILIFFLYFRNVYWHCWWCWCEIRRSTTTNVNQIDYLFSFLLSCAHVFFHSTFQVYRCCIDSYFCRSVGVVWYDSWYCARRLSRWQFQRHLHAENVNCVDKWRAHYNKINN